MAGATSSYYNLFVLRRLYNADNAGRGEQGKSRRVSMHTTITPLTFFLLKDVVPTGKGQFSAPVVEMGIRIQLALLGRISMDTVAEEMKLAFLDRASLARNLRALVDKLEQ